MLGDSYLMAAGLRVTALALRREQSHVSGHDGAGDRLALRARVENPAARPLEFDNLLGVVDGTGYAYARGYTDAARYPGVLPGLATVAPGAALEGDVYVDVDAATPGPFSPAYLMAMTRGCGGCPGGANVELVPLARWEPVRL
jgi:hypothetical protein